MITAAQHNQLDFPEPAGREEAQQWLTAMVEAALADGKISPEERALLASAAQRAGLGDWDIAMLIKRVRAEMYSAAQNALRGSRGGAKDDSPPGSA